MSSKAEKSAEVYRDSIRGILEHREKVAACLEQAAVSAAHYGDKESAKVTGDVARFIPGVLAVADAIAAVNLNVAIHACMLPPGPMRTALAQGVVLKMAAEFMGLKGLVLGSIALWKMQLESTGQDPTMVPVLGSLEKYMVPCGCAVEAHCPWCCGTGQVNRFVAHIRRIIGQNTVRKATEAFNEELKTLITKQEGRASDE